MFFLNRTYPFKQSGHWLRDCIFYGVVIWAILYMLQPFGFSMYQGNKFLVAGIFGLITSCCYALYGWGFLARLTQRVRPWRIWHQGCAIIGLILLIAVGNFILFSFIFHCPITLRLFLMFLYWTVIIGIFISAVSISIQYNQFLREKMEALLSNTTEEQKDISITIHDTNVRGNDLCIPINSLLYIEAKKNNVSVCCLKDGKPTYVELHTTLSAVVEELKDYANIFQCHRSFVVNVNNITSARGNSNGYQLTLGTCTDSIPVSRSYVPQLKAFIA
ncbi:MAG: LytTR family transcriptional regulator DNA-binding domain-containing protein [Prevotella sp.]|nr:LytTR family transcriptional regulator DNA-binding domain-containing protein [Prevotella sp.]MBP5507218.1 LytTR family transcriptional regulator DNA-binding domain-containing protein [Prevotella sp.]